MDVTAQVAWPHGSVDHRLSALRVLALLDYEKRDTQVLRF